MAQSEQAKQLAEKAEGQLGKIAETVREKFDKLTEGRRADRGDQVDKGQDETPRRAGQGRGDASAG